MYERYIDSIYCSAMLDMAILGLLEERDLHGYEIRRQLREHLGLLANVSFGSIYPALTRLEKSGAVVAVEGGTSQAAPAPPAPPTGSLSGELAVLRALGIPRWRLSLNLAAMSFWVGVAGVALALPAVYGLSIFLVDTLHLPLDLPWWLVLSSVVITLAMAILAGLSTLGALRRIEPMVLLR